MVALLAWISMEKTKGITGHSTEPHMEGLQHRGTRRKQRSRGRGERKRWRRREKIGMVALEARKGERNRKRIGNFTISSHLPSLLMVKICMPLVRG